MSKLFTTILPSLLAGGLLFGSALTGAQPAPPAPPAPPAAAPPRPPKAPKAPNVKIKGDIHIDLHDIDQMVDEQIKNALDMIGDNEDMPPQVREAAKAKLEKIRVKVKKHLSKISPDDLEQLSEELGKMGEELGDDMEQFGKDMEKFGKDFEKQMEKKLEKQMRDKKVIVWKGPHDNDDDFDDEPDIADFDAADDDVHALRDLGDLKLDQGQRKRLKDLRDASERDVKVAKQQLDKASDALRRQLESGSTNEADISRAIDDVTRAEAAIRKARILTWVKARKELDDTQRRKVEARKSR